MKLSDFKTTKELTDMLEQVFAEGTPAVRSTNPMYINTEALRDGVKAVTERERQAQIDMMMGNTPPPCTALERLGMELLLNIAGIDRG